MVDADQLDPGEAGLSLPSEETAEGLIPVRMLNELAYCPRLFYLMHVEGRWEDNVYTIEGKAAHRRVDNINHVLPDPERIADQQQEGPTRDDRDEPPIISRSISLSSRRLGLTAKLDIVSIAIGPDGRPEAVPVETKRGSVPDNPQRSYEPERVQLMGQGLLLREAGYQCDHGILYFAGSRTRVEVPFSAELEARTMELIAQARNLACTKVPPSPLEESPKCNGCSLAGICLPDETSILQDKDQPAQVQARPEVRQFFPKRDYAMPVYIQEQGSTVCKSGKTLIVKKAGNKLASLRLADVSQVVLLGNVSITPQTIHLLCEQSIPLVHLSSGGWFYGLTQGHGLKNAYLRAAQFEVVAAPTRSLEFARQIVWAKINAQRTLLRRNGSGAIQGPLQELAQYCKDTMVADSAETLLGIEGLAAKAYFGSFTSMLKGGSIESKWAFLDRNRRPPRDPINALLSFGYALLVKDCMVALLAEGFDPYWGLFHQPKHGKPALALDLMEEFRPLIVDSAVITAINTRMVSSCDFEQSRSGCAMRPSARKAFIRAYEVRLDQLVTHPVFRYRCSWRTVIRLQAKLLARWVRGEVRTYPGMVTR